MPRNHVVQSIDDAAIATFDELGFLVVENVLDETDLAPLELEYESLLDGLASELYAKGAIDDPATGSTFGDRYALLLQQKPELHQKLNI